jgi:hypothetical protein
MSIVLNRGITVLVYTQTNIDKAQSFYTEIKSDKTRIMNVIPEITEEICNQYELVLLADTSRIMWSMARLESLERPIKWISMQEDSITEYNSFETFQHPIKAKVHKNIVNLIKNVCRALMREKGFSTKDYDARINPIELRDIAISLTDSDISFHQAKQAVRDIFLDSSPFSFLEV